MKLYNKKELLDRLDKGFDLKDDEYRVLIRNGNYMLAERLYMLTDADYVDTFGEYMILGTLASRMNYGEDYDKDLSKACGTMMSALPINLLHYINGLKNSHEVLDRLCRFNTVNFLNEVAEIKNYDTLLGDLHDSIREIVEFGFNPGSSLELQERVNDLEESKGKIKVLRNKYIK